MDKIRFAILAGVLFGAAAGPALWAAAYDIKEMTPEIQKALSSRQGRFEEIQQLKAQGLVGEDNRGLLKSMNAQAPVVVVESENADRAVIYEAIAGQNGLGPEGLVQVQKVFGEVQRDKAKSGDFIQLPSGEWAQK